MAPHCECGAFLERASDARCAKCRRLAELERENAELRRERDALRDALAECGRAGCPTARECAAVDQPYPAAEASELSDEELLAIYEQVEHTVMGARRALPTLRAVADAARQELARALLRDEAIEAANDMWLDVSENADYPIATREAIRAALAACGVEVQP